ncbi:ABC transporter permease [Desulfogranum japonicum]|uniref:ABC transporter permease n=1 Tax=Desulfogranum japonicum TaxID=231447 RepID=UPI0004284F36|nr:FtsX-like permease family protein [Desulfogranum japonicum]
MERLPPLPLKKSLEIAFQSIRVRFFRSLVTTTSLVLAVAFLSYTQTWNDLANSLFLSHNQAAIQKLIQTGFDINENTQAIGESPKQQWLMTLALLVCVVGIINAQLMAVTERFREIGTMKCLGALDRVVLLLFVLEAGMQGLAGSLAGAFLGSIAGLLQSFFTFGSLIWSTFPVVELLQTASQAVAIGCLLSLIGVLYPALQAARMQPVVAMRMEQ